MAATTTPRPKTRPGPRPRAGSAAKSGSKSRTVTVYYIGPWQNALEGAGAVLCAVVAMAVVSASALALLGAGAVGSLWSLTMATTAMAVGGAVSAGSDVSGNAGSTGGLGSLFGGGGGMSPSMSGAADAVPLGVTLVGTLVLWVVFSRRLGQGQQRRFTGGELAVRVAGAVAAAMAALVIVAALGKGSVTLPKSVMGVMGGIPGQSGGGDAGGLSEFIGGGMTAPSAMTYQVNVGQAAVGAALWAGIVLGVGFLISRRVRLPLGGVLDGLRSTWLPSLSAVVRTVLVIAAVMLVPAVLVGAAVGGRAGTGAGGALLLTPNVLAVVLTLGVGGSWTAGMHPVQADIGSNPLASLMGGIGGMGGSSGLPGMGGGSQTDRTEHLRALAPGGVPLWLTALAVTGAVLLACAYRASRKTAPAQHRPLHPYRGPLAQHLGMAERFGVVTAVVLGGVAWLGGVSGNFAISIFGSQMGGVSGELNGSVLGTVVFGLLVGGSAGLAGSLLSALRSRHEARWPRFMR